MAINFVNLAGLAFDAAGAFLLGRAVVFNSKEKIAYQLTSQWDYNRKLIPSMVEQRIDASVGLVLLISGFGLQAWSAFQNGTCWYLVVALCVLAVAVLVYGVALSSLVERGTKAQVEFMEELTKKEDEASRREAEAKKVSL